MAIPTGSGTEVLKRFTINTLNYNTVTAITGVANHIYTVLSIVVCENQGNPEHLSITMNDGTNDIDLVYNVDVPANGTYVWNDRFVISGTDLLKIRSHESSGMDVIVSYIDQDWS
jgi:hypothetical protein